MTPPTKALRQIADTDSVKQRRHKKRIMCADLLTIRWTGVEGSSRSETATLEDITVTGACLHLEQPIPPETKVSLHYENGKYEGIVKYCTCEETGYLLGIAFDDNYRWSRTDFQPSHLLELPPKPVTSVPVTALQPKTSNLIN
jgi:hypothetical protein